jgi:hypothetical protein
MSDAADLIQEAVDKAKESRLNSVIALSVAVTATVMALCNVKDDNIVQAMQQAQASSIDTWSYFQAKSTKQAIAQGNLDQLRVLKAIDHDITPDQEAMYGKKLAEFEGSVKRYEVEKAEIKAKAESFQTEYDRLNLRDDQFDMSEAAMSISIALFGVTALTQKKFLFVVAAIFAGFGLILGIAAFASWTIHPDFLARLLT